jgi:predicted nucleic acid-binding protein
LRILLDASVAAAWLMPGQRTASSETLLNQAHTHTFEAPHIFPMEVRNALLTLERRGRYDAVSTAQALQDLATYDISIDAPPDVAACDAILDLARRERLSVYDGLYLWQAMRNRVTLASRDGNLLSAAMANGVAALDLRS